MESAVKYQPSISHLGGTVVFCAFRSSSVICSIHPHQSPCIVWYRAGVLMVFDQSIFQDPESLAPADTECPVDPPRACFHLLTKAIDDAHALGQRLSTMSELLKRPDWYRLLVFSEESSILHWKMCWSRDLGVKVVMFGSIQGYRSRWA